MRISQSSIRCQLFPLDLSHKPFQIRHRTLSRRREHTDDDAGLEVDLEREDEIEVPSSHVVADAGEARPGSQATPTGHYSLQVTLYPNPANQKDLIFLTVPAEIGEFKVSILDTDGQVQVKLGTFTNARSVPLNIRRLPSGMYFVRIEALEGIVVKKLTINK